MIKCKPSVRILFLFTLVAGVLSIIPQQVLSGGDRIQEQEFMIEIENEIFQSIKEEGGLVSIVTVTESEIIRPSTRGEMAMIYVDINNSIHGSMKKPAVLTVYTKDGQSPLVANKKYLVVLKDVPLFRPRLWLEAYQAIECQDCGDVVNLCKKLLTDK